MKNTVYLYVFDTMSDWEIGYLTAELNSGRYYKKGLAQAGLLNSHWHTSNNLEYLKMICPAYTGEKYHKMESVVTDGKLITASGIAPLEFSVHVLKSLGVFPSETLDAWYSLNKTQESKYFYELMNSIQ